MGITVALGSGFSPTGSHAINISVNAQALALKITRPELRPVVTLPGGAFQLDRGLSMIFRATRADLQHGAKLLLGNGPPSRGAGPNAGETITGTIKAGRTGKIITD